MAANDRQRQFDQIVAHLTSDYPSLADRRHRPRKILIATAVVAGVVWALLSVAMVAWGAAGVVLTCLIVASTGAGFVVDAYRHRDH